MLRPCKAYRARGYPGAATIVNPFVSAWNASTEQAPRAGVTSQPRAQVRDRELRPPVRACKLLHRRLATQL